MKIINALFASALAMAITPVAIAASTVDLTVGGSIVPSSCTPALTAPNLYFGKLAAKDLNQDLPTRIGGDKTQILTIDCQLPTRYALRGIDNRADSVGNGSYAAPYGLGLTANNEKIGAHYFSIVPNNSIIDNALPYATVGNASGTSWSISGVTERAIRNNGELLGFNLSSSSGGPVAIKVGLFTLKSLIVIAPAKSLTLDSDVTLDGAATIEVVYL